MIKIFYINIPEDTLKRLRFVLEKLFNSLNKEYSINAICNITDIKYCLAERNSIIFTGEIIYGDLFISFIDEAMLTNYIAKIIVIYKNELNLHYLLPMRPSLYIKSNNLDTEIIVNIKKLVKD